MESDEKTYAAPPCQDNEEKGAPKTTSVQSRWEKRKRKIQKKE
jgi:hypothetical protein